MDTVLGSLDGLDCVEALSELLEGHGLGNEEVESSKALLSAFLALLLLLKRVLSGGVSVDD